MHALKPELDKNKLYIFHELKKHRKWYVGELTYDEKEDVYKLNYDEKYRYSRQAIPIGPHLDLFSPTHISEKGKMFPIFLNRIPSRANPAYKDYCELTGISIDEKNPIVLLGSIGQRGPSTFVFEPAYKPNFSITEVIQLRQTLMISQQDFAKAFGLKKITLQRLESGISHDENTLKLLAIYLNFPDVALWQLRQRKMWVHHALFKQLFNYFKNKRAATDSLKNLPNK